MGAVEGEHPGEDAGGRTVRAGARSSSRHPSKAATTRPIWASILHPSTMRRTMPRRQLREHRRPRHCHRRPIPTSVPTAHPRSEILTLHLHASPIFDMGDHGLSDVVITDDDDVDTLTPLPAASFALYWPYDHRRTSTPVFDAGQSDGGCRFPSPVPCDALWRQRSLPRPSPSSLAHATATNIGSGLYTTQSSMVLPTACSPDATNDSCRRRRHPRFNTKKFPFSTALRGPRVLNSPAMC
ncbi:hypothetical protein EDD85DRAFT_834331, partial [Armillaria nabsnona]